MLNIFDLNTQDLKIEYKIPHKSFLNDLNELIILLDLLVYGCL